MSYFIFTPSDLRHYYFFCVKHNVKNMHIKSKKICKQNHCGHQMVMCRQNYDYYYLYFFNVHILF